MTPAATITPRHTLAELATTRPGAARVFHRHHLDFCCNGRIALADAAARDGLDLEALIEEIAAEERTAETFERWDERSLAELIDHLLAHYHEPHKAELPRLIEMARKVERVHGEKAACPRGLARHLERMQEELLMHMEKEEQVLFPLIRAGHGRQAAMPVHVMEQEHQDHGANLAHMRSIAHDYQPPAEACGTWRALYLGLEELERELMQHIHIENHILFPRALRS